MGRHGTGRVAKAVLLGAVPPLMLKTADNPEGTPKAAFDAIRAGVAGDRSQYYQDLSAPFYGANREGSTVSQGMRDAFWLQGMQVALPAAFECIKAFSETDFTDDLGRIDVPTLIVHGDDDQIVPIADSALLSSKIIPKATLRIHEGAPHGLVGEHQNAFHTDLLEFLAQ
jgi:non-heme chloroperoxidase